VRIASINEALNEPLSEISQQKGPIRNSAGPLSE
jgi:hypothetical protein